LSNPTFRLNPRLKYCWKENIYWKDLGNMEVNMKVIDSSGPERKSNKLKTGIGLKRLNKKSM
jgi:hypothetical protein